MPTRKKILAVIPARGGSKGLPGKNIRPLCGKPLIAWTIEQARASACFDTVLVSTDTQEIADIAVQYGAEVPFLRPDALASDTASSVDVVLHALDFYEGQGITFDYVALLEPTSPLRKETDIHNAFAKLLSRHEAESIVGVCKTEGQNPAFLLSLHNEFIKPFLGDFLNGTISSIRRQDIQDVYFFEGSVYISQVLALRIKKSFYHEKTLAWEVEKWQSYEIDDISDFIAVEALMKYTETNNER